MQQQSQLPQQANNLGQLKTTLRSDAVKARFEEMLGKKSAGFLTSISSAVSNNALLQKADVNSIILAASKAAALDLPIDENLGFAALVPFNQKDGSCKAQFQVMRDGWVALALRTGQFEYIVNEPVYEGELVSKNRFTDEFVFDETKRVSNRIIGYMAAFKLTNGYKKTIYWTVEECKAHGLKYSKSFNNKYGLWATNFDSMSKKTVLKHLLKKYAPKSIESQLDMAFRDDQAFFSGSLTNPQTEYLDNPNFRSNPSTETSVYEEIKEEPIEEEPQAAGTADDRNESNKAAFINALQGGSTTQTAAPKFDTPFSEI